MPTFIGEHYMFVFYSIHIIIEKKTDISLLTNPFKNYHINDFSFVFGLIRNLIKKINVPT